MSKPKSRNDDSKKKLVLLVVAVVLFALAGYLLFFRDAGPGLSPSELQELQQNQPTEEEIRRVQPEAFEPEREPPNSIPPGSGRLPVGG